jgi:MSHA biogenesis protein MshN
MSVVNKMLQDLEARQAKGTNVSADYQPPLKRNKQIVLILLLLIVVGLFGFWLFNNSLSTSGKPAHESLPDSELTTAQAQPSVTKTMLVATTRELEAPVAEIAEQGVINVEASAATVAVDEVIPEPVALIDEPRSVGLVDVSDAKQSSPSFEPTQYLKHPLPAKPETGSLKIKDSSQASQKASLRQQVSDALSDNNSRLAITLLGELLEQEPDNTEAIKKLATLLFANGNALKATQLLQSSVLAAPQRSDLRLMLARLYTQQKRLDSALAVLKEIQPAQYMEIDYLAYRANLAQQLADFVVAKQDYTLLTQVDGNNASWWLGLAITEEKLGAGNTALRSYYQAQNLAQLDPAVTEFIQQRINVLVGAK